MITVKLFETSEFDEKIFQSLMEAGVLQKDGTADYVVGYFAHDLAEQEECKQWIEFDEWFKQRGALDREKVLIHHGKFHQFPNYLFD